MIYYISDTHFRSTFIFKHCHRPFDNVKECDDFIVRSWNEKIKDEDTVYVLGDLGCFYNEEEFSLISQLKGRKILIVGNHDVEYLDEIKEKQLFEDIHELTCIKDEGREVWLCHYPLFTWPNDHQGSYFVYGHIHNAPITFLQAFYQNKNAFNAGVDVCDFTPHTLDELKELHFLERKN